MFNASHDLQVSILLFFIGASIMLYAILGGADYGAGILELLPAGRFREAQKKIVNSAMGPVWEANHMWLVILIVILFMGFPAIFTGLMTSFHIPMVALLVGIVLRGAAFTFRHYDAIQEPRSQKVYTWIFGLSSLWSSLWLGIIAAGLYRGGIDLETADFFSAYISPWWGAFPLCMGLFTASIFAFLANVYLIGETSDTELQSFFRRRALALNLLVMVLGAVVFVTSELEGGTLMDRFLDHPFTLLCLFLATLLFALLWSEVARGGSVSRLRIVAAGQAALILGGWFYLYAPNALMTRQGPISFYTEAAPAATLYQLNLALLLGSLLIFPSLFYLLKVFKGR